MINMNEVTLVGNLTKDPEIKETKNGRMAVLSIATNRRYRNKDTNEIQEVPQYHRVNVFNEHFIALAESYLQKGSHCLVRGSLEHRSYEDADGIQKNISEVVIRVYNGEIQLGNRPEGTTGNDNNSGNSNNNNNNRNNNNHDDRSNNNQSSGFDDDMDDDVPF